MKKISMALAGLALAAASTPALAFDRGRDNLDDFGWGARYNGHLSEYDGRPLGPPIPALPPGYHYYNGRLVRGAPYPYYDPAHVGAIRARPRHVVKSKPISRHAHRQR